MFTTVSGTGSNTIDIGGVVTAVINIPSGYEYLALKSVSPSDWTVVFQKIVLTNSTVNIECRKMVSGSANVTLSASVICRKIV